MAKSRDTFSKNSPILILKNWQVLAEDMVVPQTINEYYDLAEYDMIGNGTHCRCIFIGS